MFSLTSEMRIYTGLILLGTTILVVLLPLYGYASVNARADMNYRDTKSIVGGAETSTQSFDQLYTFGVSKRVTNTITLLADVRVFITDIDGKRNESSYPFLSLNFTPPAMYKVQFSYNRNESLPSEGDRITTTFMNVSFTMPPTEEWPSFGIAYNRSTTQDHNTPRKLDTVDSTLHINSAYNFRVLGTDSTLSYSFRYYELEDKVNSTKTESPYHTVSASFGRKFLSGKLRTSANIGYSYYDTTTESLAGASRFEDEIAPSYGLAEYNPPDPTSVTLSQESELIDNNRNTPVTPEINLNNAGWNIGVGFSTSQSLHAIYLYINTTVSEESNISSGLYNFGWKLYTSSDNAVWTDRGFITPSYNSIYNRFEFSFAETSARYFKVVNTAGAGTDAIKVTEIEGIGYKLTTPKTTLETTETREFGGINFTYVPSKRLTLGARLRYDHTLREGDTESEYTTASYGFNARYVVIPVYLVLSGDYSTSTVDVVDGSDSEINTYSIVASSSPLPTINANVGFRHSESITEGATTSTSDIISSHASMRVYRGVDLTLGASLSYIESPQAGTETDSKTFSWNLKLVPWSYLTVIYDGSVVHSITDNATTGRSSSTTQSQYLTISFVPTRAIYVGSRINLEPTQTQNYNLIWTPTRKLRMSFDYTNNPSSDTESIGTGISWYPVRKFSISTDYSKTWKGDDETETVLLRGSLIII